MAKTKAKTVLLVDSHRVLVPRELMDEYMKLHGYEDEKSIDSSDVGELQKILECEHLAATLLRYRMYLQCDVVQTVHDALRDYGDDGEFELDRGNLDGRCVWCFGAHAKSGPCQRDAADLA